MKKKVAVIGSAVLLLTVGGVTAFNTINPSWREHHLCDGKRQANCMVERTSKRNCGVDTVVLS